MSKSLFGLQEDNLSDKSLKGKYQFSWTEDSIVINNSNKSTDDDLVSSRDYLGASINERQLNYLIWPILIFIIIIVGRIFYLQIINGDNYRVLAEGNRVRLRPIVSERGIIYDINKHELVQNIPNFSLTLIPQDLPNDQTLAGQLSRKKIIKRIVELSGVSEDKIYETIKKYGSYSYASLVIKEDLDYEKALSVYIESENLPGVSIEKGSKRKYLNQSGANTVSSTLSVSHLLGYLGKLDDQEYANLKANGYLLFDDIGKTGLEKVYESQLRGKYGRKKVEVDAGGHEKKTLAEVVPVAGQNLILNIDIEAQAKLEDLIKNQLKKSGKKHAAAIAMNPIDGAILAMVSWPAFDNNDFSAGITQKKYQSYIEDKDHPLFNRAADGTYPSGSTIKMVMAAAALQEKIINYSTVFLSNGGLRIDRWFFPDWQAGGHGLTNVTKAIAWSVNTFFYYIGGGYDTTPGLGVERISKYMKMFGLGQASGIDLPSEASGFIPDKEWKKKTKGEEWYVGDTYNLSIGQGDLLVTPLQVAVWTSSIANGGKIVQPHLADKTENPITKQATKLKFVSKDLPISSDNLKIVKQGMGECVSYGSCGLLKSLPFLSGGKTGTAQWNNNNKQNHAWFTSFAPYENPQVVVTVLIEEGTEGASNAQPVARDFLQWWGKKYFKG